MHHEEPRRKLEVMSEPTKPQRRIFRELMELAHERALSDALNQLSTAFDSWKAGDLSAFDLNEELHRHHDGTSRKLYSLHTTRDARMAVAFAVARGVLKVAEIPEGCWKYIEETVSAMREIAEDDSDA